MICPFFLYTLAFGGILVPKLDLILTLVCREYLSEEAARDPRFTFTPLDPFGGNEQCNTGKISALATRFTLILSLVAGFLSAIVSPKLGAMSDRYGRRRLLAITTAGGVLSEIVTIVAASYPESVNYRWLVLGAFFEGICGSFTAGMAITHSYAADCTSPSRRAVAFGYFHACLFGGIALGPLLAAAIIKKTGMIIVIFYVAVAAHLTFLLFLIFVIPESLTKKRQLAAQERNRKELLEYASNHAGSNYTYRIADIFKPLKILYPSGDGATALVRRNLIVLSAVDTIIFGTAMGAMTVTVYYSKLIFHWTPYDSNIFVFILNSCRVTGLVVVLPLLNYIFRTRYRNKARRESGVELPEKQSGSDNLDLYVIRASVFLDMLGYAGYATVRTGALFTASGVFASLGGMGSPTLQSALTKHVPHDRVGQLLGATGLLHAFARIISPTVFSLMYAATTDTFPQAVFVTLAGCFFLAFVVSWFIKPHG